jgi:phosphoribosylanthranilate isomerase
MEIKVCGITSVEQLEELQKMGVHYAGLIFNEASPRNAVEKLKNKLEEVAKLDISLIGVFVDENEDVIRQRIEEYSLTGIQLHGNETPAFCERFMETVNVIKAFHIDSDTDIDGITNAYHSSCNFFLFDTASRLPGGSGIKFDWDLLEKAPVDKLFFLSGGIGPEDAEKIAHFYHPFLYAIDINSLFETSPGVKDIDRIKKFITGITDATSDPEVFISLKSD